jgi:hypothetical protein
MDRQVRCWAIFSFFFVHSHKELWCTLLALIEGSFYSGALVAFVSVNRRSHFTLKLSILNRESGQ